ncbi:MAG: alpha/beta fold hydrolase [Bacteroidia bacterium]|nr:alpha/beta fold hydrolase [Bacteroidia bacterium]
MHVLKWIKYVVLVALLGFGCYIAYFLFLHNEIPQTKANVNDQPLDQLTLANSTFTNRWGDDMEVEIGSIVVPENRTIVQSNHISISFIRIPTSNPNPGSPLFFLAGGPGTPASSLFQRSYFYVFKKLREHADVVLIDQRGTGNSIPNLRCRNVMAMPMKGSGNWEKDMLDDILQKCTECANEFKGMDIDLKGYNSKESSEDIDKIREALEMEQISLFGYSYGTSLGQHYVSMFPERVDRLILAGPTAPDLGLKLPKDLESQFEVMDSLISADPKMRKYISSFTHLMRDQHQQLKAQPLEMRLPLMDAVGGDDGFVFSTIFRIISFFKPYWKLTLSDTFMKVMMAQNSGRSSWTQIMPRYYYQLSQGEHQRLGNYLRNFRRQPMPNAIFFTVSASTGYTEERRRMATEKRDDAIVSHFDISFGRLPEVAEAFGITRIEELDEPVRSDKDVLLIGGTLDGRTPLSNLDTLYNRFGRAQKIIVQNGSHDDLVDSEVLELIMQFLDGDTLGNMKLHRPFTFLPPVNYRYSIVDTLEQIRTSRGIDKVLTRFVEIRNEYLNQDDYYFQIDESSLNNYGYMLLNQDLIEEAEKVLELNTRLFPDSDNVYNSLAEAQIAGGSFSKAVTNLKKAVDLNYLDGYSHSLIRKYQD